MSFEAQSLPPAPCSGGVVAGPAAKFSGDFLAAGAREVSFTIAGDGHTPGYAIVFLHGKKSGRYWFTTRVTVSTVSGETTLNRVSLDRAAGGWKIDYVNNLDAAWREDLRDVSMVGISMGQGGLAAQSYTIAGFVLLGVNGPVTPPAELSPLQKALMDRFGVASLDALTTEDLTTDSDGDGMADVTEIVSENDAAYANAIFFAEIVSADPVDGIVIRWPTVRGMLYSVLRGGSLAQPFADLPGATDLQATGTGFMTHHDKTATGEGPYFYKIRKTSP